MNLSDISNFRLKNQKVESTDFVTVNQLVSWMGAMQAQDFLMLKWAVGIRLLNATDEKIIAAISNGEVLRTHVMRPTWHLVPAHDIHWMLELSAPGLKSSMKGRHRDLGLSDEIIVKSNKLIEKELDKGKHLTRNELAVILKGAKINTDENRLSHLLICAELEGIVCSGEIREKKQTFALLAERSPNKKVLSTEEALAELAKRYFTSHGPATLVDFSWWSGLNLTKARQALELVKKNFDSEEIESEMYWFTEIYKPKSAKIKSLFLLPAYDEFLISYKNRNASLSMTDNRKAVSNNGIFYPIIVFNGQVIGVWKRTLKKDFILIEVDFFRNQGTEIYALVEKEAAKYGKFMGFETTVIKKGSASSLSFCKFVLFNL